MKRTYLFLAIGLVSNLSLAADTASYQGKFAFDWFHPKDSKCAKIGAALDRELSKFTCKPNETNFGGDDKPAETRCAKKSGAKEYLIYSDLENCKEGRETTLSNGD
jgi:hypothetical protein